MKICNRKTNDEPGLQALAAALPTGASAVVFLPDDDLWVLVPSSDGEGVTTASSPEGKAYVASGLFHPAMEPLLYLVMEIYGQLVPRAFRKQRVGKGSDAIQ